MNALKQTLHSAAAAFLRHSIHTAGPTQPGAVSRHAHIRSCSMTWCHASKLHHAPSAWRRNSPKLYMITSEPHGMLDSAPPEQFSQMLLQESRTATHGRGKPTPEVLQQHSQEPALADFSLAKASQAAPRHRGQPRPPSTQARLRLGRRRSPGAPPPLAQRCPRRRGPQRSGNLSRGGTRGSDTARRAPAPRTTTACGAVARWACRHSHGPPRHQPLASGPDRASRRRRRSGGRGAAPPRGGGTQGRGRLPNHISTAPAQGSTACSDAAGG